MEPKIIHKRYSDHYEAIKRIGNCPLKHTVQLADLGDLKDMKAETQRCYNDMKRDGIEDTSVLDYLCILSTLYLLEIAPQGVKTPREHIRYFIENYEANIEETRNMLRLFNKKPEYLFGLIKTNDVELYKELAGFWFTLYNQKKS